jgi:hypothetical protein
MSTIWFIDCLVGDEDWGEEGEWEWEEEDDTQTNCNPKVS